MSFLSVLKSIGTGVENVFGKATAIVTPLEPVINVIPGGAAFSTIFNSVVGVEQLFAGIGTQATAAAPATVSAAKKSIATQLVTATLPAGTPVLTPEQMSAAIDQIVAGLNQLQAVQTSVAHTA